MVPWAFTRKVTSGAAIPASRMTGRWTTAVAIGESGKERVDVLDVSQFERRRGERGPFNQSTRDDFVTILGEVFDYVTTNGAGGTGYCNL